MGMSYGRPISVRMSRVRYLSVRKSRVKRLSVRMLVLGLHLRMSVLFISQNVTCYSYISQNFMG